MTKKSNVTIENVSKSTPNGGLSHFEGKYVLVVYFTLSFEQYSKKDPVQAGLPMTDNWLFFLLLHEFWKCEKTKNTVR